MIFNCSSYGILIHFHHPDIQYLLLGCSISISDFFTISTICVSKKDFFFFSTLKFAIVQGIAQPVTNITLQSSSGFSCFNLANHFHQNTSFSIKIFSIISHFLIHFCSIYIFSFKF
ncbi:hypothetical protein HOF65_05485 [bacterium]|nr:hypothetical protein [bacterium]MBT3853396.1 hypothetical protein [bacterium]